MTQSTKPYGLRISETPGKVIRKHWVLLLMLAAPVLYVFLFSYIPMGGIVLAFKDFKYSEGILGSPWVQFDNFKFFFNSGNALRVTRNTLLYNAAFILLGMLFEVSFAVLLSEIIGRKIKRVCQSLMFMPYFISWVVVGMLIYNILSYEYGVLNNLLVALGSERWNAYDNPNAWPFIMVFLRLWKMTGYGSVVYLASITGLDQQMYEAADIDGASVWQKIRFITLPSIRPTMVIMLLLAIGGIFRGDFGMFYQIIRNNGLLLATTDIIDTYVFRLLISSSDIGMSAATGLYQSVLCFISILLANFLVKKIEPDYTLF